MNEDVKSENVRIHSRADELIACLEGEIAKRDARIVELESQYQRDVFGLNNEGDPIGGDPAGGYANDNARLRAELSALKAQDTVGEVVGWYRLDRPYEMTSYPSVCATWHKLGAPVAPLYAAPAAPAADAWIQVSERLPAVESRLDQECRVGTLSIAPLNISAAVLVFDGEKVKSTRLEWFDGCLPLPYCITHWMPLPAAPVKIEASRHD